MTNHFGLGYRFPRKSCYVCGSKSHLIKNCTFYEDKMAPKSMGNKNEGLGTGPRAKRTVWNNANRINYANKFVSPHPGRKLFSTAKPAVTVSTCPHRQVSTARLNQHRNFYNTRNPFSRSHSHTKRPYSASPTYHRSPVTSPKR